MMPPVMAIEHGAFYAIKTAFTCSEPVFVQNSTGKGEF